MLLLFPYYPAWKISSEYNPLFYSKEILNGGGLQVPNFKVE